MPDFTFTSTPEGVSFWGSCFAAVVIVLMTVLYAAILAGLSQLVIAIRDMAVNSYLSAPEEADATDRTKPDYGKRAPDYPMIPVMSKALLLAAGLVVIGGVYAVLAMIFVGLFG